METRILSQGTGVLRCCSGISEKTNKPYKFYQVVLSLGNGTDIYHILSDREYTSYLEKELAYAKQELQDS